MRLVCPACAAEFDTDVAINEANARRFFALLGQFPPGYVGPLMQYLRLHKPAKSALSWTKMLKLAREIQPMVKSARVERQGSTWVAPLELWVTCTEQLVHDRPPTVTLPLKGNGYLLSMVASAAERSAASLENAREKSRRGGAGAARREPAPHIAAEPAQPRKRAQEPTDPVLIRDTLQAARLQLRPARRASEEDA